MTSKQTAINITAEVMSLREEEEFNAAYKEFQEALEDEKQLDALVEEVDRLMEFMRVNDI